MNCSFISRRNIQCDERKACCKWKNAAIVKVIWLLKAKIAVES